MRHPDGHLDEGTIHAWLDGGGALAPAEIERVERHVAACPDCAALVAEARGLIVAASGILGALDLSASTAAAGPPPVGASTGALPYGRSVWRTLRLTPARAAAAAVLIAATGTILTLAGHVGGTTRAPATARMVSTSVDASTLARRAMAAPSPTPTTTPAPAAAPALAPAAPAAPASRGMVASVEERGRAAGAPAREAGAVDRLQVDRPSVVSAAPAVADAAPVAASPAPPPAAAPQRAVPRARADLAAAEPAVDSILHVPARPAVQLQQLATNAAAAGAAADRRAMKMAERRSAAPSDSMAREERVPGIAGCYAVSADAPTPGLPSRLQLDEPAASITFTAPDQRAGAQGGGGRPALGLRATSSRFWEQPSPGTLRISLGEGTPVLVLRATDDGWRGLLRETTVTLRRTSCER